MPPEQEVTGSNPVGRVEKGLQEQIFNISVVEPTVARLRDRRRQSLFSPQTGGPERGFRTPGAHSITYGTLSVSTVGSAFDIRLRAGGNNLLPHKVVSDNEFLPVVEADGHSPFGAVDV